MNSSSRKVPTWNGMKSSGNWKSTMRCTWTDGAPPKLPLRPSPGSKQMIGSTKQTGAISTNGTEGTTDYLPVKDNVRFLIHV